MKTNLLKHLTLLIILTWFSLAAFAQPANQNFDALTTGNIPNAQKEFIHDGIRYSVVSPNSLGFQQYNRQELAYLSVHHPGAEEGGEGFFSKPSKMLALNQNMGGSSGGDVVTIPGEVSYATGAADLRMQTVNGSAFKFNKMYLDAGMHELEGHSLRMAGYRGGNLIAQVDISNFYLPASLGSSNNNVQYTPVEFYEGWPATGGTFTFIGSNWSNIDEVRFTADIPISIALDDLEFSPPTATAAVTPTVITASATSIAATSALLGGNVTANGGAAVTERGIVWATASNPTIANNKVVVGSGTGTFSQTVTGLPPLSTIHYRAYAMNSEGTAYGANMSFDTQEQLPIVTTDVASNITATSATISGNVNALGTQTIVSFEYGTTPDLSSGVTSETIGPSDPLSETTYFFDLYSLTPSTTYYYRIVGTSQYTNTKTEGEILSFTTTIASSTPNCTITSSTDGDITEHHDHFGQSFTACMNGTLSKIKVLNSGIPDAYPQDLTLTIRAGAGLSGTILGTVSVPKSTITLAQSLTDFTVIDLLEKNIQVSTNQVYTFSFEDSDDNMAQLYYGSVTNGNYESIYPGGNLFAGNTAYNNLDLIFEIEIGPLTSNCEVQVVEVDLPSSTEGPFTKNIEEFDFTFTPAQNNYVGMQTDVGFLGLYPLDNASDNGNGTEITIASPAGYSFDLNSFRYLVDDRATEIAITLTFADGNTNTTTYPVSGINGGSVHKLSTLVPAADDVVSVKLVSDHFTTYNDFCITDIKQLPTPINHAPTDIELDKATVNRSAGVNAVVGTLSTTDSDTGDTFTYSLVAGAGDTDNASFNIIGSELRANSASGLSAGIYSVRIRTTDNAGTTFEKAFAITVVDDLTPAIVHVNKNVVGGNDSGDSWANAKKELADALIQAKTNASIQEIWVAGGTYKPLYSPEDGINFGTNQNRDNTFLLVNNVKVYGGFAGTETSLAERDLKLTANASILSGDIDNNDGTDVLPSGNNAYHVVVASGPIGTATLDGFTIQGGDATGGGNTITINGHAVKRDLGGAVVLVTNANPALQNLIIRNNRAGLDGGGIGNSNSFPKVYNSIVYNNFSGFRGGGVYSATSAPEFINVTIANNTASNGYGPGILIDGGTAIVRNSIIWGDNKQIDGNGADVHNSIIKGSTHANALDVDPIFTDAANNDYTLQGTSPAINAGQNSFFTNLTDDSKDLAGNPRVYDGLANGIIDLGAYEYQGERIIPALTADINGTDVSCFGGSNGTATVTVSGGVAPYTYAWSYGNFTTSAVAGLPAGEYTVTVRDAENTEISRTITILQPSLSLSIESISPTHVSCFAGSNGTATVTITGGTPGYTYQWNTTPEQTTATASGLSAGEYTVTVYDANGCQTTSSVTITQPDPLNISDIETTYSSPELPTGSATVYVIGGAGAYSYIWDTSPIQTTATASNLPAGTYTVTITDANNCQIKQSVTIENRPSATVTTSGGNTQFEEVLGNIPVPVAIDPSITVSHANNTTLASATISISNGFRAAQDLLLFTNNGSTMGNISAAYNAGTGVLTLTSSGATTTVAQWQSALRAVTYSNSSKAPQTNDRTINFVVNDGENNSVGATKVVTVTDVNDPPVNSVPAAQSVLQDGSLVFSTANSNSVSISDDDAGSSAVRFTMTASNGVLSLNSTSGLSFISGSGTNDGTMTFTGNIGDINSALNGLVFTPTSGYNGPASLQIVTNDLGHSGAGGAKSDTDIISITVQPNNPVVINVQASSSNGLYKIGDHIDLLVTFDQVVSVNTSGGIPTLRLETGITDRDAVYFSGSGSNALTFRYTVQEGDFSTDLDYQSTASLALNGATIRNVYNDNAILTLPAVGGPNSIAGQHAIVVDGIRPTAQIVVHSTSLAIGETSTVTFTFSEAISGFTLADLTVSNGSLSQLVSADGGITWTATFTPSNGVENPTNSITLNNTGVRDAAGNTGTGTTESNNYVIDTKAPATPTGLEAAFGNTQNSLSWTANTETDLASYRIYGGTTINPSTLLTTVNAPGTSYAHTGLINGTTYYYRIATVDQVGNESVASTDIKATPKAPQVITFDPIAPKTYGDADFAPGATSTNSSNAITYSSSNTAVASIVDGNIHIMGVGTTTIMASQAGSAAFTAAEDETQVLEIKPATLTITADAGQQKVYGQDDPVFTYNVTGYENQEDETILSGALTRDAGEDVGSYKLRIGNLTAGDNYNVNFFGNDFEITPAEIDEITFTGDTFVYDGTPKSLSIDDTLPTGATVAYTINGEVGNTATNAGTYTVEATMTGPNFITSIQTATLTITKAQPVITAKPTQTHVYDGTAKVVEASIAPVELVDQLQYSPQRSYTNVGDHQVRVYYNESTNYLAAAADVAFSITEATQQGLTLPDLTVTYDGNEHQLMVAGAAADATIAYTIDGQVGNSAMAAGSYAVEAIVSRDNYTDKKVTGTLYINRATAEITSEAVQQHTYDGTPKSVVASLNHSETGLVFTPAQVYTAAGTYAITVSAIETANYHAASKTVTLQILPATQDGNTLNDLTVTYDGQAHGLFVTGAAADATISYTINGTSGNTATTAGVYQVQAVISRPNYADETIEGTLTINRATAYILGDENQVHEFDGTAKTLSVSLNHDESALNFSAQTTYTNGGTYVIEASASQSTNYEAVRKTFTLRIDPTHIVGIELPDASFVYDGKAHQLAITDELPAGTTVQYENNGRTVTGTQQVVATISGSNYRTLVKTATLTITPAELRITATPVAKLFGAADPALAYTVTGIVVGDRADDVITGAPTRQSGEAEGDYAITRGTLQVGSNYSLTFIESTLSIHKGVDLYADRVIQTVKADEALLVPVTLSNLWESAYPAGATVRLKIDQEQGLEITRIHSTDFDIRQQGAEWLLTTKGAWIPATSKLIEVEVLGDGTFAGSTGITLAAWNPSNVGLEADRTIRIHLEVEEGLFEIITPNAFTPNGDGVNETFFFPGLELHDRAELTVLNRFGDQIYKNMDYKNDWTAHNVDDGTYFYILEVYRYSPIQGRTVKSFFRGSVLIKRK